MAIDGGTLLRESAAGATIRQLAQRHNVPKSTVARMIVAAEDDLVFRVLTDFVSAVRAEAEGRTAEWPRFIVPYGPDRQTALRVFDRLRDRLRARGLPFRVLTRAVKPSATVIGGHAFMLVLDVEESDRRVQAAEEN